MVNRLEFQEDLSSIHRDMIRLGSMAETAISKAVQALRESNAILAHEVIQGDDAIDDLERDITQACVRLIARQQPVASDLRDITANMKLVTDLERIADHAEDIANNTLSIIDSGIVVRIPTDFHTVSDLVTHMLHEALDAYVSRDLATAYHVIRTRNRIGFVGQGLSKLIVTNMQEEPSAIPALVQLILVANHLQRAADHAQNVAEWIVYHLRGTYVTEHKRTMSENTIDEPSAALDSADELSSDHSNIETLNNSENESFTCEL